MITTNIESLILKLLKAEPAHIEKLWRQSGISLPLFCGTLAAMVLKGSAKLVGDMNYIIGETDTKEVK